MYVYPSYCPLVLVHRPSTPSSTSSTKPLANARSMTVWLCPWWRDCLEVATAFSSHMASPTLARPIPCLVSRTMQASYLAVSTWSSTPFPMFKPQDV